MKDHQRHSLVFALSLAFSLAFTFPLAFPFASRLTFFFTFYLAFVFVSLLTFFFAFFLAFSLTFSFALSPAIAFALTFYLVLAFRFCFVFILTFNFIHAFFFPVALFLLFLPLVLDRDAHAVKALEPLATRAIREARPALFSGCRSFLGGPATSRRTRGAAKESERNHCAESTDENSYLQTRHD
jgi:hypothetical protein